MKSAYFRERLNEIRGKKKKAISRLIKKAVAHEVCVHILIRTVGQTKYTWSFLHELGFSKNDPGDSLLVVHSFTEEVPSRDLAIDFDDVYTVRTLTETFV